MTRVRAGLGYKTVNCCSECSNSPTNPCKTNANGILETLLGDPDQPITTVGMSMDIKTIGMLVVGIVVAGVAIKSIKF